MYKCRVILSLLNLIKNKKFSFRSKKEMNFYFVQRNAKQAYKVLTEGNIKRTKRITGKCKVVYVCRHAIKGGVWEKSICIFHCQYTLQHGIWEYDCYYDSERSFEHSPSCLTLIKNEF